MLLIIALSNCKKIDRPVIPTINVNPISSIGYGSSINKLCFNTSLTGFAACSNGQLFKTTDGGNSWSVCSGLNGTGYILDDIQFPSDSVGYVHASNNAAPPAIFKTTDRGITWTPTVLGWLTSDIMIWSSETNGLIRGSTGVSFTHDGGNNWIPLTSGPVINYTTMFCANADTIFATDQGTALWYSYDGGIDWNQDMAPNMTPDGFNYVRYVSGIRAYGIDEVGNILRSDNYGFTWSIVHAYTSETAFHYGAVDVAYGFGLAVGNSSVFVSRNNGDSWEYRLCQNGANLTDNLLDVHIQNSTSGVACSSKGMIYSIQLGNQ